MLIIYGFVRVGQVTRHLRPAKVDRLGVTIISCYYFFFFLVWLIDERIKKKNKK